MHAQTYGERGAKVPLLSCTTQERIAKRARSGFAMV